MPIATDNRAKIIDAAARLLQEHGADALTTRGIAELAGVQAPTIYRLFGDKDGLLDAVAEHVMATFAAAKADTARAAEFADADPVDDLRQGWHTYVDFGLANPTLFPLLNDPARALRSPAVQTGRRILAARVHRLARAGRLRVGEARAVELIHAAGAGTVLTLLSTPAAERDLALADDMFEAVLARIATKAQLRARSDTMAHAVALRASVADLAALSSAERGLLADWLDRLIAP